MLTVTFTMLGDVVLARAINRYADVVKDFRPVWKQVKADFVRIETEQFDSQGGRSGAAWAPLSLNYAAWKAKYFPGQTTLKLTGLMFSQMTSGLQTTSLPMKLVMGPTVNYAGIHQQGSPATRLPARKLVALTEDDKMGWMKMIHNYVYDKAKEAHLT